MSELNPYEVLGVRRNAADRTIRDAFRRLSKIHHPDAGGRTEQFAVLVAAQQILTDAPRRAWYDEHGWDRGTDDNIRNRAVLTLSAIVQGILMADEEPRGNLVQHMRASISQNLQKQRTEGIANHDKVLRRLTRMEGRFLTKRSTLNEFESILQGHKREVEQSRRSLQMNILVNEAALRILDEYDFEEKHVPRTFGPAQFSFASTSTYMNGFR